MICITFQQNTTAYVKLLFRKAKSLSRPAAQAKHEAQKKTHLIFFQLGLDVAKVSSGNSIKFSSNPQHSTSEPVIKEKCACGYYFYCRDRLYMT